MQNFQSYDGKPTQLTCKNCPREWAYNCGSLQGRDGKESELSKNEPNKNPDFANNWTEPENLKKNVQEPEPKRILPRKSTQNRIIIKELKPNTNPKFWVIFHL